LHSRRENICRGLVLIWFLKRIICQNTVYKLLEAEGERGVTPEILEYNNPVRTCSSCGAGGLKTATCGKIRTAFTKTKYVLPVKGPSQEELK
jgi:hypothetical protein